MRPGRPWDSAPTPPASPAAPEKSLPAAPPPCLAAAGPPTYHAPPAPWPDHGHCLEPPALKTGTAEREKERGEIKNEWGIKQPESRAAPLGNISFLLAKSVDTRLHSGPRPASRVPPKLGPSRARGQGGEWACRLGPAGRRPGSEQSRPAPLTWGWGGASRLGDASALRTLAAAGVAAGPFPTREQRPFGTMGTPSPASRRGDTKAEKRGPARSQAPGK